MSAPYDVIDVLTEDHRVLRELLEQLDREDRPAEMRALFLRIVREFAAHEAAEHDVVFPAARAAAPAARTTLHDLAAEHDEVDSLLDEMLHLDPAGFGFVKRASALILELQAHFLEEEDLLFPQLRSVLDPAERAELAVLVRAAKRSARAVPAA